MRMYRSFTIAVGCLWPLVMACAAPIVLELSPSSPWNMRYEAGSCELVRNFGEADEQIITQFTRIAPGDGFNLRLYGKPFRVSGPYQDVLVAFGESPASMPRANQLSGVSGELPFVELGGFSFAEPETVFQTAVSSNTLDRSAAVNLLTIGPHHGKIYSLKLGSMRAPMMAMRTCTDDLVRSWGYDPEVIAGLARPVTPIGNPLGWASSKDYPTDLLRRGKIGTVRYRIDVDEVGKVTGCNVLRWAGDVAFAKLTCELLTIRAQFLPALDRHGKPAKSFWISGLNFLIPK